jgi:hypothetical protein
MPKFRLPAIPTWDCDSPVEIADWWEIEALRATNQSASLNDLRAGIARQSETDPSGDAEADIEEESRFDFSIAEVKYRISGCNTAYPFEFKADSERVLLVKQAAPNNQNWWLYVFLLLATRLNMNTRRTFADIDGTLLFEEVCEVALKAICGPRFMSHRFGTSSGQGNFPNKLKGFFAALREFELRTDREIPNHGGDDGLDIALWNTFSWSGADVPPQGKLVLLAQCKTGTSWDKADLQRLHPTSFFDKWMSPSPLGATARAFMVSGRVDGNEWEDCHRDGGLFFDRCRIVDYAAGQLPDVLFARVRAWTEGAISCVDLGVR